MSAFGHGIVIAALLWMPAPKTAELPGVVMVDLVALAAPAAAGKPASLPNPVRPKPLPPAPEPAAVKPVAPAPPVAEVPKPQPPKPEAPKPPPPPPPKNETVIPKTPQREPEKPKVKADPEPKPEPEPKPRTEPKPPPKEVAKVEAPKPPPPKPQESYDDLLADLRAERGESRPSRVERPKRSANAEKPGAGGASTTPAARASGTAAVAPEVASWLRAARLHVRQAWVLPAGLRREPLETQVEVELDAQGNVLSEPKVTQRSGNPWYDESVVRAIQKASPLPPPPEPGSWPFVFRPEDLG